MALDIYYKKERHPMRWVFTIISIVIVGLVGWQIYKWYTTGETVLPIPFIGAGASVSEGKVTSAQIADHSVDPSLPRYIRIPSLGADKARVFPVGLDDSNQVKLADNAYDTSWYEDSATPGGGGVVLMSGRSAGNDGLFNEIGSLKVGSEIEITRGDGEVFVYTIAENLTMSLDELNSVGVQLIGQSVRDTEGLNIIIPDGNWVPRLGTHDKRILVRATLDS